MQIFRKFDNLYLVCVVYKNISDIQVVHYILGNLLDHEHLIEIAVIFVEIIPSLHLLPKNGISCVPNCSLKFISRLSTAYLSLKC